MNSKLLVEFGARKSRPDGKRSRCKSCEIEDRIEYFKKHPEAIARGKIKALEWHHNNRDRAIKSARRWHENNLPRRIAYARNQTLRKYGLTPESYVAMEKQQNGRCKICGSTKPGHGAKHFYIDHCHKTMRVRGLLCCHCNMVIGQLGDDADRIRRAAEYVEKEGAI